jgi:hypothetical protein
VIACFFAAASTGTSMPCLDTLFVGAAAGSTWLGAVAEEPLPAGAVGAVDPDGGVEAESAGPRPTPSRHRRAGVVARNSRGRDPRQMDPTPLVHHQARLVENGRNPRRESSRTGSDQHRPSIDGRDPRSRGTTDRSRCPRSGRSEGHSPWRMRVAAPLMRPVYPSRSPPTTKPVSVISYSRYALLCWLPRIFTTTATFLSALSTST